MVIAKKSNKKFLWLLLPLVVVALGYIFWPAKLSGDRPVQGGMGRGFSQEAVPVSVHRVARGDFVEQIKALGTVTAWRKAEVTSQVGGILQQILFQEGQEVTQGYILAQIDDRTYQAALLQTEGALQETRAQLVQAELELKRYQGLSEEESIARQTLEQQQALVNQLRGTLKVREAQRDAARLDVEYSRISAPISGRLGLRAVDVGNHISAGSTVLVTITQQQPIAVSFTVAEQHLQLVLQALAGGEPLKVQVWSRDEQQLLAEGVLDSIDNQVDINTGTVKLKARFDNAENNLYPQQFVNVRLQIAVHQAVLLVPNDTIQFGSQGRFVWRVQDDQTVVMQPVELGLSNADFTLADGGITEGDLLVLEGVDRLKSGSKVEVIDTAPTPTEQPAGMAGRSQHSDQARP